MGGVASATVTVKLALPVLPEASVAVHVTVFAPDAKVLPDAGAQAITGAGSSASLAVAGG